MELKEDVRLWKQKAKEYIPPWPPEPIIDGMAPASTWKQLWISLYFYGNWYTKDGKVRTIDLCNLVKVTVDAIAEKLGFNDSMIFEQRMLRKIQSEEQKVEVELGHIEYCSTYGFGHSHINSEKRDGKYGYSCACGHFAPNKSESLGDYP